MSLLDENDPAVILHERLNQVIDKHCSLSATAALALCLSSVVACHLEQNDAAETLRRDLVELAAAALRMRNQSQRES